LRFAADACGDDDLGTQYVKIVDKLCACTNATCLNDVEHEASDWMEKAQNGPRPSEAVIKKIKDAMDRKEGCASRILSATPP
jgi:hypothetical protein